MKSVDRLEGSEKLLTAISLKNLVTCLMFSARKVLRICMCGSLNLTLLAKFCITFVMSSNARLISLDSDGISRSTASGVTIAGQKNRRKMNDPMAE